MPTEKPIRQKLTLSNLATTRPSETPGAEQPAIASTKTVALGAKPPVSLEEDAPTVPNTVQLRNTVETVLNKNTNTNRGIRLPALKIALYH